MELHQFWNVFLNYWIGIPLWRMNVMGVTQPLLGILERGTSQGRKYWCLFKSQRMILRWFHSCSMSAFDEWCAALDLLLSKDWTLLLSCATRRTIMLLRLLEHPSPFFNPRKNAPRSQRSTHRKVLPAIRILDLHILYFKGQNLKYKRIFRCFIHFSLSRSLPFTYVSLSWHK